MEFSNIFNGKKVIVTGHTGFKGSWLSLWLNILGAEVIGLSIDIPSNPSHFKAIKLQNKITQNFKSLFKLSKSNKNQINKIRKSENEISEDLLDEELFWNKLNRAINKIPITIHKAIFLLKFFI